MIRSNSDGQSQTHIILHKELSLMRALITVYFYFKTRSINKRGMLFDEDTY